MTTKAKVSLLVAIVLLSFAVGRYTTPTKTSTKVETVEVEKKSSQVDSDSNVNKHKESTTKEVTRPDGTKETTTTTVEDTTRDKKTSQSSSDERSSDQTSEKEVVRLGGGVNISVMVGALVTDAFRSPTYGASFSKELLGPITGGVWFLTNGTVGASLGLNL